MNIYVESNFVLEPALLQEQHASCEGILRLCEVGNSADEEAKRLEKSRSLLSRTAEILPLGRPILEAATRYQIAHDLSPHDARVYAAVLSHLTQSGAPQSCFLNMNSKDFDDPDLGEELNTYNCRPLSRFDVGYRFILGRIS